MMLMEVPAVFGRTEDGNAGKSKVHRISGEKHF